jgi:putative hydrolase of the HAD superfamily
MVILFDLDDTLLNHSRASDAATAALHARVKSPLAFEEFASSWTSAHRRHFDRYLAGDISFDEQRRARIRDAIDSTLSEREADDVFAIYLDHYEASWSLFSDTLPCLDGLSRHRLGVVSNGQTRQQRLKLERMGIAKRFECVVVSEECGCAKPAPEIFLRACSLLGAEPENAIYVGDLYDVGAVGARDAGLVGVWLDRAGMASVGHVPPLIRSLYDLPPFVATTEE